MLTRKLPAKVTSYLFFTLITSYLGILYIVIFWDKVKDTMYIRE